MWAAGKNIQKRFLNTLSFSLLHNTKSVLQCRDNVPKFLAINVFDSMLLGVETLNGTRLMSTSKGRSMRSKVEKQMRRDVGKTQKEIRHARNIRKKLMTEEERLIWSLRKAKKKVALLLQKLKKYELPDLPPPRHDPELLTSEQLQAYKKIGFRNRNYVPVGVRGVFGGVVQNMHLHWKFHETVQVCCDNFPKEKIKEMATMLARLSGGIVVNVHDVKTIIMFRGRNYRQPKNLIPINTLTKRKALFKARFEQALESQKLNIKKIEQQLRRKGVNPEDPVALASIQRVASTFFSAIDDKQGTPYVFHGDKTSVTRPVDKEDHDKFRAVGREDHDGFNEEDVRKELEEERKELEKFIDGIEEAAELEWEEEEAAEKEELGRMRYWNREDSSGRLRRLPSRSDADSEDEIRGRGNDWNNINYRDRTRDGRRLDSDNEDGDNEVDEQESDDLDSDVGDSDERGGGFNLSRAASKKHNKIHGAKENFKANGGFKPRERSREEDSGSEDMFDDSSLWGLDDEEDHQSKVSKGDGCEYLSSDSEDGEYGMSRNQTKGADDRSIKTPKQVDETWDSD